MIESLGDDMPALLAARLYFNFIGNYEAAFRDLLGKGFELAPVSPTRMTAAPAAMPVSPRGIPEPGMILIPAGEFLMEVMPRRIKSAAPRLSGRVLYCPFSDHER